MNPQPAKQGGTLASLFAKQGDAMTMPSAIHEDAQAPLPTKQEEGLAPLIAFRQVHYSYSAKTILCGVDFEVFPGESVVITGPSGAGKSTLIRLAAGLLKPTAGYIARNVSSMSFVFQEPRLLPWRTVLENVILVLSSVGKKELQYARELLEIMGLSEAEQLYPKQLSGGMRQRVSLVRALVIKPSMLILDEPFTGLDQDLRNSLKALLELEVVGKGISILQVTHHKDDILQGTRAVYRLENGQLTRNETNSELQLS